MKPIVLLNLKTYAQGTGDNALAIATMAEKVAKDYEVNLIIAAQDTDIRFLQRTNLPIWAQKVEPVKHGSNTGHTLPEAVAQAGAQGTLLNHSENRVRIDLVDDCIVRAKEAGLEVCVCANTDKIAQAVAAFEPDYIAMEPPELIGGDVSVSKAQPELITETINKVAKVNPEIPILVGAGVKTGEDLKIALQLGAGGVLLASGVVCAKDPEKALRALLDGLN